jgi:hemerythrin
MDNQHVAMIQMLNELYDAMMEGNALGITGPLLHKLVAYTQDHFAAEEQMMASSNYPGLQDHIARHRQLIEEVHRHVQAYERQNLFLPISLLHFLRDWLATHIQKEDRAYGPCMNRAGNL